MAGVGIMLATEAESREMITRRILQGSQGLRTCLEEYVKFCDAIEHKEAPAVSYRVLLTKLNSWEFKERIAMVASQTFHRESESYKRQLVDAGTEAKQYKVQIAKLKDTLANESNIRAQKQEYDDLWKQIAEYPSRKETHAAIGKLEQDLKKQSAIRDRLDSQIERRTKQFYPLLASLQALKDDWRQEESRMGTRQAKDSPLAELDKLEAELIAELGEDAVKPKPPPEPTPVPEKSPAAPPPSKKSLKRKSSSSSRHSKSKKSKTKSSKSSVSYGAPKEQDERKVFV